MKVRSIVAALMASSPFISYADVDYQVSFDNAVHHEANIKVTFTGVKDNTLQLRMSRSSPGRYALHEFAKNVYQVSAKDSNGKELELNKPSPYQWNVKGHDGTVVVEYTLFADLADGTYSQIDRTHAHLNAPASFMWAKEMQDQPITISFKPFDPSWKIATQLERTSDPMRFKAKDLQYFMDSPVELSDHSIREWKVKSAGEMQTIKMAIHHDGIEEDVDEFVKRTKKVVEEQIKVFGEAPEFDFGEYVFIACYLPHVDGDGMEHRNSTILTNSKSLDENEFKQLGTVSHEFFHVWNVERIRPQELEPFDFERANMTRHLWFAEGLTTYYDNLMMKRAEVDEMKDYLKEISTIVNQATLGRGSQYFSPEGASMMAPFADAGIYNDRTNFSNVFFNYYTYGRAIGMALDLSIRAKFPGKSLDSYMKQMWQDFGRQEKPYTRKDLVHTLGKTVSNFKFANDFFERYVYGQEIPDYEALLKPAGIELKKKNKKKAYLGKIKLSFEGKQGYVDNTILVDSPLYRAGVDHGDEIIQLGRRKIHSNDAWEKALEQFEPGDNAKLIYKQRGVLVEKEISFIEDPQLVAKLMKKEMQTDKQKFFRASWIGEDDKKEADDKD